MSVGLVEGPVSDVLPEYLVRLLDLELPVTELPFDLPVSRNWRFALLNPSAEDWFENFYARNMANILTTLIASGLEREDAEDGLQEAMIMLAQRYWEVRSDPVEWVVDLARSIILAPSKVPETDRRRWETAVDDVPEVPDPGSAESIHSGIDEQGALRLFDQLPARQREVMILTFGGNNSEEVAALLGIAASTVRNVKMIARKHLRGLLHEHDGHRADGDG